MLGTLSQLGTFSAQLKPWLAAAKVPNAPVFMTEFNVVPSNLVDPNQLVEGLWVASSLGEFIHYFGDGGGTNLWNILAGGATKDDTDQTAGDLGYLQFNDNAYHYQPHASYGRCKW